MCLTRYRVLITALCHLFLLPLSVHAQEPLSLPPPADATEAIRRSFYTYDRNLQLDARLEPLDSTDDHTRYKLNYASVHDQRVPAILSIPKRFSPPYPA